MAIALHRLTGLPFGIWAGKYTIDGGEVWEKAHAVVIVGPAIPKWMDVYGVRRGQPNLGFAHKVSEIRLLPASEEDIRTAFTTCEILRTRSKKR
jgi:hypothetical protein